MVTNKKPQRNVVAKTANKATEKLMENQDMVDKGDGRAVRTARVSFSTRPEIVERITDEAHDRRMSRSQLIEKALIVYLGISE